MASTLVAVRSITKSYKIGETSYDALSNVSLEITEGELLAIMGPSGSGKSTLLNLVGGLDRPTSGEVVVSGQDLSKMKKDQLAIYRQNTVGFIFQNFNLLPAFTALENTNLALVLKGQDDQKGRAAALESLKWIGLEHRVDNRPTELSGGEQQRVAIVRALVKDPPLILADEPTGNLDSKTGDQIIDLIKSLKERGKTIVVVTHNEEVAKKADRVIQMKDGEVVK
jgi:putative ABC transport system ATP-binding protein